MLQFNRMTMANSSVGSDHQNHSFWGDLKVLLDGVASTYTNEGRHRPIIGWNEINFIKNLRWKLSCGEDGEWGLRMDICFESIFDISPYLAILSKNCQQFNDQEVVMTREFLPQLKILTFDFKLHYLIFPMTSNDHLFFVLS